MSYQTISVQTADRLTRITLNRPARLNVADGAMCRELRAAVEVAAAHAQSRVIILTGSGERAFCAGYDVNELARLETTGDAVKVAETVYAAVTALERCPKPVICAVNGLALGLGVALVLAADCALAADNATFGLPEIAFGVPPAWTLLRGMEVAGRRNLAYLALTAQPIDAPAARRIGLVHEVVASKALAERSVWLARRLVEGDAGVQARIKCHLNRDAVADSYRAMNQTPTYLLSQEFRQATRRFMADRRAR